MTSTHNRRVPTRIDPETFTPQAAGARPRRAAAGWAIWWDGPPAGRWMVAGLAVLAAVVLSIGVATPWPWGDEGATYLALQRSWSELLVLFSSPDAPWVPYYALAKAWAAVLQLFAPGLSTLVAVRLLSVLAGVGTVVFLYAIVARNAGRLAGVLAGVLLLTLPGFARHAQDARGYALLGLAATLSWLLCDRWLRPGLASTLTGSARVADLVRPGRRARVAEAGWYAGSLAAVAAVQTFGLLQWPAHLLAALAAPASRPRRRRRLASWVVAAGVAALLVAGQVLLSVLHGTGATHANAGRVIDAATVSAELLNAIGNTADPLASVPVLLLVVVGAAVGVRGRRDFSFSLLIWLVVPLLLAIGIGTIKTNLFRLRYWVAFLPPLAALAALGVVAIAVAAAAAVRRIVHRADATTGEDGRPGAVWWATAAVLVAVQFAVTLAPQQLLRSEIGHGENFTEVMQAIERTRADDPQVIIAISSRSASGMLAAIDPPTLPGNPLRTLDPAAKTVFTVRTPSREVRRRLAGGQDVLWVYRGQATPDQAVAAMPRPLRHLRGTVVWARAAGAGWTVVLLSV